MLERSQTVWSQCFDCCMLRTRWEFFYRSSKRVFVPKWYSCQWGESITDCVRPRTDAHSACYNRGEWWKHVTWHMVPDFSVALLSGLPAARGGREASSLLWVHIHAKPAGQLRPPRCLLCLLHLQLSPVTALTFTDTLELLTRCGEGGHCWDERG